MKECSAEKMRRTTIFAILLAGVSATGVKRRSEALGQARFTDTFSLLSKLNSNPYAFNQAFPATAGLVQKSGGAKAAEGDAAGLGALLGGTTEAATVGSDAAADAVSGEITDLFNLQDQAKPDPVQKAPPAAAPVAPAAAAPKPEAPAPKTKPAAKASTPVTQPKAAVAPPAPKTPETKPKPAPPAVKPAVVVKPVVAAKPVAVAKPAPAPKKATVVAVATPKPAAVAAPAPKIKAAAAAPQPPKPAVKKVMAMVAAKTNEKSAELSKEAELEAELAALKAKLAQRTAPPATPSKAATLAPVAPKPAARPPAKAAAPKKAEPVPKKVAVATPPAPVPKKAAVATPAPKKVVVAKSVAKKAPVAAPQAKPAAHTFVHVASIKAARTQPVQTQAVESQEPEWKPEYAEKVVAAPQPQVAAAKPVVQVAAAKPVVQAAPPAPKPEPVSAPVIAPVKEAAPTAAPAPEELTMTMVPPASVLPRMEQSALAEPLPSDSFFGSVGHFFHRMMFGADPPPAPMPTQAPPPDPNAGRPVFSKQDIEKTEMASHDDGLADVAIGDEFSRKEKEDISLIDRVKREDRALRIDAETPKRPAMPAPANYVHEHGSTHISSFWGTLADEDADIESALTQDGDDLTEYERLRKLQDEKVRNAVGEISGPLGEHMALERRALRKAASAA